MREIQDSDGIRSMVVKEPLNPHCAIGHRNHLACLLHPPLVDLRQSQVAKGLGIRQAREVGKLSGMNDWLPVLYLWLADGPHHQGLHLSPLASCQRDHRPIDTE